MVVTMVMASIIGCFSLFMLFFVGWSTFLTMVAPWIALLMAVWAPIVYLTVRR